MINPFLVKESLMATKESKKKVLIKEKESNEVRCKAQHHSQYKGKPERSTPEDFI